MGRDDGGDLFLWMMGGKSRVADYTSVERSWRGVDWTFQRRSRTSSGRVVVLQAYVLCIMGGCYWTL